MGFLTIIKKIRSKEKHVRLLILGLDNAGKTTIVKKICKEPIDTISPTLGFNIKTITVKRYRLTIWDVGGQKSIRAYWRNYFERTDGVIWVVDSADKRRLEDCKKELHELLVADRLTGASLLILANKQDLNGALSILELGQISSHNWMILPCSAITGENLEKGFEWIVQDVASRLYVF